jgi:hypothetical protein
MKYIAIYNGYIVNDDIQLLYAISKKNPAEFEIIKKLTLKNADGIKNGNENPNRI